MMTVMPVRDQVYCAMFWTYPRDRVMEVAPAVDSDSDSDDEAPDMRVADCERTEARTRMQVRTPFDVCASPRGAGKSLKRSTHIRATTSAGSRTESAEALPLSERKSSLEQEGEGLVRGSISWSPVDLQPRPQLRLAKTTRRG